MEKIKAISEAFSMQPYAKVVQTQEYFDKNFKGANNEYEQNCCKEIKLERVIIGDAQTGDVVMAYVGYNFSDQKLFQYIATSVNVEYDTNPQPIAN